MRLEVADIIEPAIRQHHRLPTPYELHRRMARNTLPAVPVTVGEYLTAWIIEKEALATIRDSTIAIYETHIRHHLIPHLGHLPLTDLRPHHIRAMLIAIIDHNHTIETGRDSDIPPPNAGSRAERTTGPATRQRILATLRNALNDAIADELITKNPAIGVKTPVRPPTPRIWTPENVARWQEAGETPSPVMVWTAEQTGTFLDHARVHAPDLFPLLHFAAYHGTRLGEVCGLRDAEVRIEHRSARITHQITTSRHGLVHGAPKSAASRRDVFFTDGTRDILAAYRDTKADQRQPAGDAWPDTGLFFVRPDGQPWNPRTVSQRFTRLAARAGLPPIRFHDLRHGAATRALEAGIDIKVIQEQLGHTTSTLTRGTYQSVDESLHRTAAAAVARTMKQKERG